MRPERNPLDLNNLPEDSTRDGRQALEDSSSIAGDVGATDVKDDSGKVYECRFCSLKFCKSQALGGHMNRHRQERETETLNRARQLVYTNDNLIAQAGVHHLGGQPIQHGGFHQASTLGDPTMAYRPVYPTRLFSGSSPTVLPPPPPSPLGQPPAPHQSYMYASPSRFVPFSSQYPPAGHPVNDYIIGHALSGTTSPNYVPTPSDTN